MCKLWNLKSSARCESELCDERHSGGVQNQKQNFAKKSPAGQK